MTRTTMMALLVALVASFALSAPADAAPKKTLRARAKHSSRVTTGAATTKQSTVKTTKPAVVKTGAKKRSTSTRRIGVTSTAKKPAANRATAKRKPATKPR